MIHVAIWAGLLAVGLTESFGEYQSRWLWIAFGLFPVYTSLDSYRAAQNRQLALTGGRSRGAASRDIAARRRIRIDRPRACWRCSETGLDQGRLGELEDGPWFLIAIGIWLYVKRSQA